MSDMVIADSNEQVCWGMHSHQEKDSDNQLFVYLIGIGTAGKILVITQPSSPF
jgi:hypothetical protein